MMSASLIGRLGQALSGYPPLQCRCRSQLALLFGIGTKALPAWDPRTRQSNLLGGLAVKETVGASSAYEKTCTQTPLNTKVDEVVARSAESRRRRARRRESRPKASRSYSMIGVLAFFYGQGAAVRPLALSATIKDMLLV